MFKLDKLPKDVLEKISAIEFFDKEEKEDTGNMGIVWLENDYVFEFDESHTASFINKKDLIDLIKSCIIKKKE